MGKIADVQEVTLEKLIPYVNNAKIHNDDQITRIASSIREFGFLNPVLIDKDFNIVIEPQYIFAENFYEGKANVSKGKWIQCVYQG